MLNNTDDLLNNLAKYKEKLDKKGYVKIPNIFDAEYLDELKGSIRNSDIYKKNIEFSNDSSKNPPAMTRAIQNKNVHFRNDSVLLSETLDELCATKKFKNIIKGLTNRNMIRTNDHVFEIAVGSHPGIEWHVGYYSFSFIRPSDPGYTLWIPLDPITDDQGGGMVYIPRNELDGGFLYPFAKWNFHQLRNTPIGQEYLNESISKKSMVNVITDLIEKSVPPEFLISDTFSVGDAFFFDKFLLHRTAPFLEGVLKNRMALVVRFVDSDSLYDKDQFYSLFRHFSRAALSNGGGATAYYDPEEESNEKNDISPKDPFMANIAKENAPHLTPIKEFSLFKSDVDKRHMFKV